ncbi:MULTISPECIES: hypothetical protein [Halomicrobium]|uniref:Cox cluster protein n=3 Tax=Halomicrobium mukohataei TaxID=57705 RepID=C7NYB1_HALMD|nr:MULTISPECIES: hypothetical protein [Halomicrobium]ACV48571.1 conserved hypothetical protein [Halomicrobium mukohataei DSM 12286]QCD66969.1 hypothetical protein E5139_15445 [Halomicrobium mukohataei]QFR21779.1 hypothetical protein GBQ70_15465 [Halomicrobium sp. ZPS1]
MTDTTTIVDRIALGLSGALFVLGIVVMGVLELLAGKPYSPTALTNDAGEVIATPLIDPTLRTGIVIAALLVLAVWGAYKLVTPMATDAADRAEMPAD